MKAKIPAYVVTGFLDAGKTTFLNHYFSKRNQQEPVRFCVLQFESGEEVLQKEDFTCDVLHFTIAQLELDVRQIAKRVGRYLKEHVCDELWIEWNGTAPVSILHALFSETGKTSGEMLADYAYLHKMIHISEGSRFLKLVQGIGMPLLQQIAESDLVIFRGTMDKKSLREVKRVLHTVNPDAAYCEEMDLDPQAFTDFLKGRGLRPLTAIAIMVLLFVLLWILSKSLLPLSGFSADRILNVFLGIVLEAMPFLMIGVLFSSAVQYFLPAAWIEMHFPKKPLAGMLFAVLAGFCLPACDCASVPIFQSMVRKGVPLPSAVVFMAVTPIVNPIVLLSTYYAFGGSWRFVLMRTCCGICCALFIGTIYCFLHTPSEKLFFAENSLPGNCTCTLFDPPPEKPRERFNLFLRHACDEFFQVGKYLLMAAFVSAVLQTLLSVFPIRPAEKPVLSTLFLMGLAFLLSMCSTSDAVVAHSLSAQFPTAALLAFLVFGPIVDLKNVSMLSSAFRKRWVVQFASIAFFCSFVTAYAVAELSRRGGLFL